MIEYNGETYNSISDRDRVFKNKNDQYCPITPEEAFEIPAEKDKTELINEMKEAIEWYMDNTTVMNPSRSYYETFHDLGMNLRMRAEDILNKQK